MELFLQQLVNGVMLGSVYWIAALGLTLLYAVLKIIQLAHGQVIMYAAYFAWLFLRLMNGNLGLALGATVVATVILCLMIERVGFRPMRDRAAGELETFVIAIGFGLLLTELCVKFFVSGQPIGIPQLAGRQTVVNLGPAVVYSGQLIALGSGVTIMGALALFLYKTKLGSGLRAMAENMQAARLLGVNVNRMAALSFALAGTLAAVAGILLGMIVGYIKPDVGGTIGFKALAIVLFAGPGNVYGAAAGALLLGLLEVIGVAYVSSSFRDLFAFALIIVVLLVRPQGLFAPAVKR